MVKRFCRDCKKEQIFDTSYDEECLRCSECGCLPYEVDVCEICNGEIGDNPYELNNKVICLGCYSSYCDNCYEMAKDEQQENY